VTHNLRRLARRVRALAERDERTGKHEAERLTWRKVAVAKRILEVKIAA
jgi:hypothetical protein